MSELPKQLKIKASMLKRLRKQYQSYTKETKSISQKIEGLQQSEVNEQNLLIIKKNKQFLQQTQSVLSNVKQKLIEAFEGLVTFLSEKGEDENIKETQQKLKAEELVLQHMTKQQTNRNKLLIKPYLCSIIWMKIRCLTLLYTVNKIMNTFLNVHSLNSDYTNQGVVQLLQTHHQRDDNKQTCQNFNLTYTKDNKKKYANRMKLKNILKNKDQANKVRSSSTVTFTGVKQKAIKFQYYYKSIKQQQKQGQKKQVDNSLLSNLRTMPNSQKSMSQQMLESMKKYLRKIEKNKIQLKKKSEQSNYFGLKVHSIQKQIHFQGQNLNGQESCNNIDNRGKVKKFQSPKKSFLLNNKIFSNSKQNISKNQRQQGFQNHSKTQSFMYLRIDEHNITRKETMTKSKYSQGMENKKQKTIKYRTQIMKKNMTVLMNSYRCKLTQNFQLTIKQDENSPKQLNKHLKYTYYVGYGNNRNLIRSIFKKRWWWIQTSSINQANFVWTQLKNIQILQKTKLEKLQKQEAIVNNKLQNLQTEEIQVKIEKKKIKLKKSEFYKILEPIALEKYYNIFHQNLSLQEIGNMFSSSTSSVLQKIQRPNCVHNHYQQNYMFGNKNALYHNIKAYFEYLKEDMFDIVPLTFYIDKKDKSSIKLFQSAFKEEKNKKSIWIVKPAQNSNRGQGIFVSNNLEQIKRLVSSKKDGKYILQKYLKNNFLFQKRKFDIRTYVLMVTIGNCTKYFWYKQGYLRTSSQIFNLTDLTDIYVHLTNDAIQITSQNYGKYQNGNKLTYAQFQRYLDLNYANRNYSMQNLNMQMKTIAKKSIQAIYPKINTSTTNFSFELFGLDFLIDSNFRPWLLEINTNPCLELSSPILQRLIPRLIQNMWRITVDIMFQPDEKNECSKSYSYFVYDNVFETNKFQLIFDSFYDRDQNWEKQCEKFQQNQPIYQDQTQIFVNDGKQIEFEF